MLGKLPHQPRQLNMDILNNRSIRTSLFLAFGLLCAFSIISSAIGIYANSQLRKEYQLAIEENIPSMASMVQVSTEAVLLTKLVPQLYNSETDEDRRKYWRRLQDTIDLITLRLQNVLAESPSDEELKVTLDKLSLLRTLLGEINSSVEKKILYKDEIRTAYNRVIHVSTELFEKIDKQALLVGNDVTSASHPSYSLWSKDIVLKLQITGYRLVHTFESIYNNQDSDRWLELGGQLNELSSDLDDHLIELKSYPSLGVLHALAYNLKKEAILDRNIFNLRSIEEVNLENSKNIFQETEVILESVNYNIGEYVSRIQIDSILSSQIAISKVRNQHIMVIFIGFVSIFFSVLVMWLYVKRRIVDRIDHLNKSMRIIASGNLNYNVPVSGADEIGAMANSLISFRDQLYEKQFELVQASKLAAIGQLSAGISHEINQPLTAIGHYSRNGSRMIDYEKYNDAKTNFENIVRLVKKATAITSRLKSIARKPQENLYEVNIYDSVNDVVEILSSYQGFKTIDVKVSVNKSESNVLAEQVQLEQVVLNIVKNSIDALETIEGYKFIEIVSRRTKGYCYLDIKDNGTGIPKELEGKIFDPFFTTKNSDKGLGLGLAISYSIIKSFGGDIKTKSNSGQGAIFSIKLVAIS